MAPLPPAPGDPSKDPLPPRILTPEQIAGAARRGGFQYVPPGNASQLAVMVAIAMAESGGNMFALNSSGRDESYGLWQINMKGGLGPARRLQFAISKNEMLYDPTINAQAAMTVYRGQGYGAWTVYSDGKYRQYIDRAHTATLNPDGNYPTGAPVNQGEVTTIVGGKIPDMLGDALNAIYNALIKPIVDWITGLGLRVAGFVGGGILVVVAIVLYIRNRT